MGITVSTEKVESINLKISVDTKEECGLIAIYSIGLNGVSLSIESVGGCYEVNIGPFDHETDASWFSRYIKETLNTTQK